MAVLSALALLPLLTFISSLLVLWGSQPSDPGDPRDWRTAFVRAATIWGGLVVLFSEGLSLFGLIQRGALAAAWSVALVAVLAIGWRKGYLQIGWRRLLLVRVPGSLLERGLLGGMAAVAAALFAIAWISPPNNVDSLIYHMPRVVHWAQNQSVSHYPAIHISQLIRPHWAALAILNLRVLWGSDHPANLIQWFSMIGSVVAATGAAKLLGAGSRGRLLAGAAVITIPMGVMQATTTQNDYVTGFWAICLAFMVTLSKRKGLSAGESVALALAAGLGFLSKGTFFAFGPPMLLWYFLPALRLRGLLRYVADGALVLLAIGLLNLGLWARNIATYGGPYGQSEHIRLGVGIFQFLAPPESPPDESGGNPEGLNPDRTTNWVPALDPIGDALVRQSGGLEEVPDAIRPEAGRATGMLDGILTDLGKVLKSIVSMMGWNMVTPSSAVNNTLRVLMARMPWVFDEGYLYILQRVAWNHEDSAGNPLHLGLVPVTLLLLVAKRRGLGSSVPFQYCAFALLGYAILPIVATAGAGHYGIRYQLPFFVLWPAALGAAASALRRPRITAMAGGLLLLSAVPYVLLNNMRPLVGMPPWPTRTRSILLLRPAEVLFATNLGLLDDYEAVTRAISRSSCTRVGLRIESNVFEYPFWWLLDAPQSGRHLEVMNIGPPLNMYNDPSFEPCAIICSFCQDRASVGGLPRALSHDSLQLFLAP